jgi:hypothetical protein
MGDIIYLVTLLTLLSIQSLIIKRINPTRGMTILWLVIAFIPVFNTVFLIFVLIYLLADFLNGKRRSIQQWLDTPTVNRVKKE